MVVHPPTQIAFPWGSGVPSKDKHDGIFVAAADEVWTGAEQTPEKKL